jgi:hypothetical protein
MLGSNYWNGDTSLLFGVEIQALVSSQCSPETSCYSPISNSITSKLYMVPRRGRDQRMEMLPTLREISSSSKLLQVQDSTIWWMNTCPWHDRNATLRLHSSNMLGACLLQSQRCYLQPKPRPGQLAKWWDCHHVILGLVACARLKATILLSLTHDVFVICASMMTEPVTPDFPKKIKCISYVRQDQFYTHMIDVMSEISINCNKNVQELNHYIISLLHPDVRLKGLYNDQTITMKTKLHLHLPQAHDWGHASLRTPRSRWSTLFQCSPLNSG